LCGAKSAVPAVQSLDVICRVGHSCGTVDRNNVRMTGGSPGRRAMNMNAQQLVIWAVIGIIAGWLASVVVGGGGGLLRYLITGLIGAFVGGFVFNAAGWKLNLGNEWVDQIVVAAIGAIIIVILARLIA
jgi:uncharacterized membrane protein YeaQ/YmgE (transglycosylase-associated protein family)